MSSTVATSTTEPRIWKRVLRSENGDLPRQAAEFLLGLDLEESDHERLAELNAKANDGSLSDAERAELEEYLRVGDLIAILQSKARRSLRSRG